MVTRIRPFKNLNVSRYQQPVNVTIQLAPKESDFDRARVQSQQRAEELARKGHRFRNFLECESTQSARVDGACDQPSDSSS